MLTAITIENFKGISEPVRLELRPITLLFGQNSAGKSSILHALNYFRAILEDHELDLDYVGGEPNGQRLGGFRNFVHKHDLSRPVRLRADFTFSDSLSFGDVWRRDSDDREDVAHGLLEFEPSRGWVEVAVCWHQSRGRPFVVEYTAGMSALAEEESLSEEEFAEEGFAVTVQYNPDRHEARILRPQRFFREKEAESRELSNDPLVYFGDQVFHFPEQLPTSGRQGALPLSGELIEAEELDTVARAILTKLLLEPYECLRVQLLAFRWIAAWRDVPPRPLVPSNFPMEANWSGGLAAWRELLASPLETIAHVNQWLADPDKLDLGYSVRVRSFALLDRESRLWNDLVLNRAFDTIDDLGALLRQLPVELRLSVFDELRKVELHPQDIGMGLLHTIPVLTVCLRQRNRMLPEVWGLDEPELHLHPKAQAAMGDLLLGAARTGKHWHEQTSIIATTHSQHLVLRLLRRIRESNRGGASGSLNPNDVGIWHLHRAGDSLGLQRILVDVEGEFVQTWPEDDTLFKQAFQEKYS